MFGVPESRFSATPPNTSQRVSKRGLPHSEGCGSLSSPPTGKADKFDLGGLFAALMPSKVAPSLCYEEPWQLHLEQLVVILYILAHRTNIMLMPASTGLYLTRTTQIAQPFSRPSVHIQPGIHPISFSSSQFMFHNHWILKFGPDGYRAPKFC